MEVPKDVKLDLEISKGYVVTTARNILVDVAIKNNYDYTLEQTEFGLYSTRFSLFK